MVVQARVAEAMARADGVAGVEEREAAGMEAETRCWREGVAEGKASGGRWGSAAGGSGAGEADLAATVAMGEENEERVLLEEAGMVAGSQSALRRGSQMWAPLPPSCTSRTRWRTSARW
eukprot:71779-Chlamydomonas_euryale.AAC.1